MAGAAPGKKASSRPVADKASHERDGDTIAVAALESELERIKLQNVQLLRDKNAAKEAEAAAMKRCEELEQQVKESAVAKSTSNEMVALLFRDLHSTRIEKAKAEDAFQSLLRQLFEMRTSKARAENAQQKLAKQVRELKQQLQQQREVEIPTPVKGKGKRELSVLRLVSELKRVKATAERAEGELQKLREEKERVEESQDMIVLQTEALLQERQWLMSKMEQKDADARNLQQEMDKMVHELNLMSGDREVLLSQFKEITGLQHLPCEILLEDSPMLKLHSQDSETLLSPEPMTLPPAEPRELCTAFESRNC